MTDCSGTKEGDTLSSLPKKSGRGISPIKSSFRVIYYSSSKCRTSFMSKQS